jgi:hypothetical protein
MAAEVCVSLMKIPVASLDMIPRAGQKRGGI